ncbi:MAG: site-specific integrase [Aquabacterium sp.]
MGTVKQPSPNVVTIQDVFDRAYETHYADKKDRKGVLQRWKTLSRFLDPQTDVTTITRAVARDVQYAMRKATWTHSKSGEAKPYAMGTINRHLALLGKLMGFAQDEMDIPVRVRRMPKFSEGSHLKRRALKPEEFTLMVSALENHEHAPWRRLVDFLKVLWGTGCRLGEVKPKALQWGSVDFVQRTLYWQDTKSGAAVCKPMNEEVYAILKARRETGLKAPFSDVSMHALREAWDWLCAEVLRITDRAERARLVPHSIRHSAVTRVLRAGHSGPKTQRLMGHKSYQTTQRYEHLEVDDLRDAAEALRSPARTRQE